MSHVASAWVKNLQSDSGITRSEKLVLWALADYHNDRKHCAWPSIRSLAEDCLMSCRRVQQLLRALEGKGIVSTEERMDESGTRNQTNTYRFVGLDTEGGEIPTGVKSPTLPGEISHTPPVKSPTLEPLVRTVNEPPVEAQAPSEGVGSDSETAHFAHPVALFASEPAAKPKRSRSSKPADALPDPKRTWISDAFVEELRGKYPLPDFDERVARRRNSWPHTNAVDRRADLEAWLRDAPAIARGAQNAQSPSAGKLVNVAMHPFRGAS